MSVPKKSPSFRGDFLFLFTERHGEGYHPTDDGPTEKQIDDDRGTWVLLPTRERDNCRDEVNDEENYSCSHIRKNGL